jgi:hypothetical protein
LGLGLRAVPKREISITETVSSSDAETGCFHLWKHPFTVASMNGIIDLRKGDVTIALREARKKRLSARSAKSFLETLFRE